MNRLQSLFSILLIVLIGLSSAWGESDCADTCAIAISCMHEENIVWATDGKKCYVLHNSCYLKSFNCNRQNNCKDELKVVTKEECQKLCPTICTADYNPICAIYNDKYQTFSNQCALESHICLTGELWGALRKEEC